jgi:uroporphyrinogen-III decarboxylase
LFYDDPKLLHEILDTLCNLWIQLLDRVQKDIPLDWYFVWEDMCSKIAFMLERGRYIPGLDHGVPPDVSWDNYRYFYERLRELIWKYAPAPQ